MSQVPQDDGDDTVAVTVPADPSWLGVLRTASAALAARLGFSGEKVEDLRIAVDEACAILLPLTPHDSELSCRFEIATAELTVAVSAPLSAGRRLPEPAAFDWKVLSGLTSRLHTQQDADQATIRLITTF